MIPTGSSGVDEDKLFTQQLEEEEGHISQKLLSLRRDVGAGGDSGEDGWCLGVFEPRGSSSSSLSAGQSAAARRPSGLKQRPAGGRLRPDHGRYRLLFPSLMLAHAERCCF